MWFYYLAKIIVVPLIKIYHRISTFRRNQFDHKKNYVVVGNHVSQLDPIYIAAFYPTPLHYMAKRELFDNKFLNWLLRHVGAFPVSRESADIGAIKTALRLLKNGESMGIFPEGGRAEKWDEQALKQGAAFLALKTKTPVLPVAIFGTRKAKPKGKNWIKPVKIQIIYGKPIPIPEEEVSIDEYGVLIKNELEKLLKEGESKGWSTY